MMTFKKTSETLPKGAHTLDRGYYVNPNILKKEYEKIFFSNWICIGRASELSSAGKFITINVKDENIIVLCDDEGQLRAFYNVCRHRGTQLCNKKFGEFSKTIQCGYHGWTFNLHGDLIGAPHMEVVDGFEKKNYPLHEVSLSEWEGFVFINLSDEPEKFNIVFKPIINRFKAWEISKLVPYKTKKYIVKGNWKLVIQNYCECYHCPVLHPDLASIHNYMGGRNDFYDGPFLGGYIKFNKDKDSITATGKLCCPPIKNICGDNLKKVYYYSIFPNLLLSLHPEYVMYHTVWPDGVDRCKVYCTWLFEKGVLNSNEHQIQDAIDFWDITNKQDWQISELSQLGIQSKKYAPAPYSGQESLLAAYDNYYLKKIKID